jgi:GR25 family glycosyltransferase involved in LPS biosynthesis
MNQNVEKPHIYILSADGHVRSKSLLHNLKNLGFTYEIVIGYHIDDGFRKETLSLQIKSLAKITGRYLSDGEIAGMLTHRVAQEKAVGAKNIVFLEDDAILGKNFSEENIFYLMDYINLCEKPTIISLYAEYWSVFLSNKKNEVSTFRLLKAIYPPAGAVGYIMSEAALTKATRTRVNFELPADWPIWSRGIDFYFASDDFLHVDKNPKLSIIGDRTQSKFSWKNYILICLRFSKIRLATRYQIIQPLIWKFAVRFGKPYRKCEDNEASSISRTFPLLS